MIAGASREVQRTVTIVTPENVAINYQLAGAATRSMALLIDLLIQAALIVLIILTVVLVRNLGIGVDLIASFLFYIAIFCIMFVYNIYFEMIWGGRTPGKKLFGLRVIRDGGYPINLLASCIRNILRFIDLGIIPTTSGVLLLWGTPGLMFVFMSGSYKRIGDYAAGTIVIHEDISGPFGAPTGRYTAKAEIDQLMPLVKNLDRISVNDYGIIRRFTNRRARLEPAIQAAVAERIARPILAKLDMSVGVYYQSQYADLLEAIERQYREENGLL